MTVIQLYLMFSFCRLHVKVNTKLTFRKICHIQILMSTYCIHSSLFLNNEKKFLLSTIHLVSSNEFVVSKVSHIYTMLSILFCKEYEDFRYPIYKALLGYRKNRILNARKYKLIQIHWVQNLFFYVKLKVLSECFRYWIISHKFFKMQKVWRVHHEIRPYLSFRIPKHTHNICSK